jgi:lipoprotein signal peptidase
LRPGKVSAEQQQRTERRLALVLVLLVAVDLVTKALATHFLEPGVRVGNPAFVEFTLVRNSSGFGVWAAPSYGHLSGARLLALATGQLAFAAYLLGMQRLRWSWIGAVFEAYGVFVAVAWAVMNFRLPHFALWALAGVVIYRVRVKRSVPELARRVIAGYGLEVLLVIAAGPALEHAGIAGSSRTGGALVRVATTVLSGTVLWLLRQKPWRVPFLLFTAAGLGNVLSQVLPPHAIVDFIFAAPLAEYLGHGVMNVADLYFDAGLLTLLVLVAKACGLYLRRTLARAALERP